MDNKKAAQAAGTGTASVTARYNRNSTTTRKGRGRSQKNVELVAAAVEILKEIQPTTVRSVCYQLFIKKLIPSMAKNHTNAVGTQLVWARENGHIPWEWIVDESREAECISTWDNPEQIIRSAVKSYRKDYWTSQPNWVEVWSEKGTIRGTLAPVLNEYGVTFRVMHGYGSATSLHEIAEESAASHKSLTVLYVGDWDPSGMNMSEVDIPKRMERYNGDVEIIRVALNSRDVAPSANLPSFEAETKTKDPRYKWFLENYGSTCWELDALSPVILRQRVKSWIIGLIDMDTWNQAIIVERAEAESMGDFMNAWKNRSISLQASKYSKGGEPQ